VPPPRWIVVALRWLAVAVVVLFSVATAFAAVVVPYRIWDSLAFGSWSRAIAKTGDLWAGTGALNVSRPLFYVPQGLLWRFVTEDEWIGRVLSATFAAILVVAVWQLARELGAERPAAGLMPALAVLSLLTSAELAAFAAAGMTDVPVGAACAATAGVLWSRLTPRVLVPLAALGAAATVLAKPSGLLALAGLALATAVLRGRRGLAGLLAIAIGVGVALAYDAWQAARLDVPLETLLRAGNDSFWLERGTAARWDTILGAAWLGDAARFVVVYGLLHGLARAAGLRSRIALAVAAASAVLWSVVGPLAADGDVGYPFDGSILGIVAWLALATAVCVAPFFAEDDDLDRRSYFALLLWLAPIALLWATQRPDEPRLLAPAWPAFTLLAAAALTSASLSLLRFRPPAAVVPAAAVAVIALANVVSVDGLGRDGWRQLLDLGRSRWSDRAEMENFAYGPFSYHLNLARANVGPSDRIVSSDGRLQYFFPGQVEVVYPRTCAELVGARFFSFLSSGESLEFADLAQQSTNPLGWLQCATPHLELVGEQEGIYAAFVVGAPPARPPTPDDCHIQMTPGQMIDAVFGSKLSYADAVALQARALEVGFTGTRLERTGCSTFRVVVTGVPDDPTVQADFEREADGVGLPVEYEHAVRYPEVAADALPVASR
jgi:hypothetical protein